MTLGLEGAASGIVTDLLRASVTDLYSTDEEPSAQLLVLADALGEAGRIQEESWIRENVLVKLEKGGLFAPPPSAHLSEPG